MTCINMGNAIVCINPGGRLHLGNRYVWLDFHPYCRPSFSWDRDGDKPYDPIDESDPIWPLFGAWFEKYQAAKQKQEAKHARNQQ